MIAIVHAEQHGEEGYQGLPATYISLDEAVHLLPSDDVLLDLSQYPLLCAR